MREKISNTEINQISTLLKDFHGVFYKFWEICRPEFSDEVDTACVAIDKNNKNLYFLINKDFWNQHDDYFKTFIVAHEAYHIINEHGRRANGKFNSIKNIAMDVPINEGLVRYFGFSRTQIDPENKYCWFNCFFDEKGENDKIQAKQEGSYEYYYDLLKKSGKSFKMVGFGDHAGLPVDSDEIFDILSDELDEAEAESLKNILDQQDLSEKNAEKSEDKGKDSQEAPKNSKAGTGGGGMSKVLHKKARVPKPKWEKIIKKWAKKFTEKETEINHWAKKHNRLMSFHQGFMLPAELETDARISDKDKVTVWFVMDVSGSCIGLAQRFFNVCATLPKHFKVRKFCFDTQMHEIFNNKTIGGGGTCFRCIENTLQAEIAAGRAKKTTQLIVVSDGYGTPYKPQNPKNWTWLLTTGGCRNYINPQSKIYDLTGFE